MNIRKRSICVLLVSSLLLTALFWLWHEPGAGTAGGGEAGKKSRSGAAPGAQAPPIATTPTPAGPSSAVPAVAPVPVQAGTPAPQEEVHEITDMPPMIKQQLSAISAFKDSWTPAQKKMSSALLMMERAAKGQEPVPGAPGFGPKTKPDENGMVMIDIKATVTEDLSKQITAWGGKVINQVPSLNALRASFPADKTGLLAERADVSHIKLADLAAANAGPVNTVGNVAHNANGARTGWASDGSGMRIGVLSNGVDNVALSQARGELGTVTVVPGQAGSGDEGTAMLEIIYDIAPGAQLYFATGNGGRPTMAANIRALRQLGCNIIVDDVYYFVQPAFDDDEICDAVNEVCGQGVLYFSSSGNRGSKSHNTSSTYEANFNSLGNITLNGFNYQLHRMSGTTTTFAESLNTMTDASVLQNYAVLNWSDEMDFSGSDYDLYTTNAAGTALVSGSLDVQDGDDDPLEAVTFDDGERVLIARRTGEPIRQLHLDLVRDGGAGTLQYSTSGSARGHNAAVHANAFCVAAVAPPAGGGQFTGGTGVTVRDYSSDGPRQRFTFDVTHNPTGSTSFQKPDMTAIDGVATSVAGFENFPGTSAAAPHAAAMAALLLSYNPALTAAQVRTYLTTAPAVGGGTVALDIEGAGWDLNAGFGIVMPARSLAAVAAQSTLNPDSVFTVTTTEALAHTGTAGESFTPRRGTFTLSNTAATGGAALNWSASEASPWLVLSTSSGTLPAGTSTTLTYSLDGAGVSSLAADDPETKGYIGAISFSRTGNSNVKHASISLNVAPATSSGATFLTEIEVRDSDSNVLTDNNSTAQDFAQVTKDGSKTLSWTIKNLGKADLSAISATLDGTDAAQFSISQQPDAVVQENGTTTVSVKCSPTSTGAKSARLLLASNDTDENPFEINLAATSVVTEFVLEQPAGTELTTNTQRYFGATSVNTTGTSFTTQLEFKIKNTASGSTAGNLVIQSTTIDGAAAADFSVSTAPSSPVASQSETTFTVTFRPTAVGTRNAALHIATNDADESAVTINLTGVGLDMVGNLTAITSKAGWVRAAPGAQSAGGGALSAEKYLGTAFDSANSTDVLVMATTGSVGITAAQTTDDFQFYGQESGNSNSTVTVHISPSELQGSNVLAGVTVRERGAGENLTSGLSGNRFALAGVFKNGSAYSLKWSRRLTPGAAIAETIVTPAGFGVNSQIVLQINRGTYATGTNPVNSFSARYMIRTKNLTTNLWPEWPAAWTALGTAVAFTTTPAFTTSTFLSGICTSTTSASDFAVAAFDQLRITGPGNMSYEYPRKFVYNPADSASYLTSDTAVDANDVVYHLQVRTHPTANVGTLCLYKVVPNDDRVSAPTTSVIWPDPIIPSTSLWSTQATLAIDRLGDMYVGLFDDVTSSSNHHGGTDSNKIYRIKTTQTTTVAGLQSAPSEVAAGAGSPVSWDYSTKTLTNPQAGDGGSPTAAVIMPGDIAFDYYTPSGGSGRGRLYIADRYTMRIRRVDFDQNTINTVIGGGTNVFPVSTTTTKPPVYKASSLNMSQRNVDGMAIDKGNNVFLSYNFTIIRISTPATLTGASPESETGTIGDAKVIAGNTGRYPNYGEVMVNDVDATKSTVEIYPTEGLSVDTNGHVYYVDIGYSPSTSSGASIKIRMVTPNGNRLLTIAGNNSVITTNQYYNSDYTGPAFSFPLASTSRPVINSKGTLFAAEGSYYYRWFW